MKKGDTRDPVSNDYEIDEDIEEMASKQKKNTTESGACPESKERVRNVGRG